MNRIIAIPSAAMHENAAAAKAMLVLYGFVIFHRTALPISTPIRIQETSCFKKRENEAQTLADDDEARRFQVQLAIFPGRSRPLRARTGF